MLRALVITLKLVGLKKPVRRVYSFFRSRGFTPWKPLVPEAPFYDCVRRALIELGAAEKPETIGDYLEFGVSRGTSMAIAYRGIRDAGLNHMRLIGFDSFEGLPPEAATEGWEPGDYHSTMSATRSYLRRRGVDLKLVTLIKGWFGDTLSPETRDQLGVKKASLIMIDCDIYSASKQALAYCEPLMHDHATIMFDDWGWMVKKGELGQKEAFEEFLAENPSLCADPRPAYFQEARVFFVTRRPSTTLISS